MTIKANPRKTPTSVRLRFKAAASITKPIDAPSIKPAASALPRPRNLGPTFFENRNGMTPKPVHKAVIDDAITTAKACIESSQNES
jgi:hypothetical protein